MQNQFKEETAFLDYYHVDMTYDQQHTTMFCINNDCFLGIGRKQNSTKWYPLVETDGRTGPYIVNELGEYELAANERVYFR